MSSTVLPAHVTVFPNEMHHRRVGPCRLQRRGTRDVAWTPSTRYATVLQTTCTVDAEARGWRRGSPIL
ncbi:hypothetical protein BC827DRAFT_22767 [Russula dissimulans]|nr:hypothetical protein BC827DRAFT_22767 [Russula dissimulans]